MNYYESVVIDFLRADRALFVNKEYCIQINAGSNPDISGPHWYCDAVAVDFRKKSVFLCEISYAKNLGSLTGGSKGKGDGLAGWLRNWHENWPGVCAAIVRDSLIPEEWPVRVWAFVPNQMRPRLRELLTKTGGDNGLIFPQPIITDLEDVVPWKYPSWNRSSYEIA